MRLQALALLTVFSLGVWIVFIAAWRGNLIGTAIGALVVLVSVIMLWTQGDEGS